MAKFYGTSVKTGRVGASVFRINRGVTVESQYQPNVANPSTTQQVEQRAKMKLASQLAATLADEVKPFGRDKMASSRNLFIRDLFNQNAFSYENRVASIDTGKIRLTNSRVDMIAQLQVTGSQTGATIRGTIMPDYVDSVMGVRIIVLRPHAIAGEDVNLRVLEPITVVPNNGSIETSVTFGRDTAATVLVYAFMPMSEAAVLRYQNLMVSGSNVVVSLEAVRKEMASGLLYSQTYAQKVLAS